MHRSVRDCYCYWRHFHSHRLREMQEEVERIVNVECRVKRDLETRDYRTRSKNCNGNGLELL